VTDSVEVVDWFMLSVGGMSRGSSTPTVKGVLVSRLSGIGAPSSKS
jgi:hypothetical protein